MYISGTTSGTARVPSVVGSDANSTDRVAEAVVRLIGLAGMIIGGRDSNINISALAT
jgi:phenylacetate-coenzyme A ligase PaaK-like adenylate-forming protein